MSRRFQFSLRALMVAMLVVAAFFGGMAVQRQRDKPISRHYLNHPTIPGQAEILVSRDGTKWVRIAAEISPEL